MHRNLRNSVKVKQTYQSPSSKDFMPSYAHLREFSFVELQSFLAINYELVRARSYFLLEGANETAPKLEDPSVPLCIIVTNYKYPQKALYWPFIS